jgi:hypothetical protein
LTQGFVEQEHPNPPQAQWGYQILIMEMTYLLTGDGIFRASAKMT